VTRFIRRYMHSLPQHLTQVNPLLRSLHQLRHILWQLKVRVPARYAVHAAVLVIAAAVALQNFRSGTLQTALKSYERLGRYFEIQGSSDGGLITEGLETLPKATGGNTYLAAGIDVPALALATDQLETFDLLGSEQEVAVTSGTALADQSISLTTIAERPREEIITIAVASGDTISTLAEEYGLQPRTVMWENGIGENTIIKPGANLRILPVDGLTHKVADGDTLEAIAKKYQASLDKILSFNNLPNPNAIKEGQTLVIPGGVRPAPPKPKPAPTRIASNNGSGGGSAFGPTTGDGDGVRTGSLQWPNGCTHISQGFHFGHTGVDIDCAFGTAIVAADGGTVSFTGWNGGYGNSIVVDHGGGFQTRYAHIKEGGILVRVGQSVSRGQTIGYEGSTGWSTGPHLHFETIQNGAFLNPFNFL
jgi:LysM repeat protein